MSRVDQFYWANVSIGEIHHLIHEGVVFRFDEIISLNAGVDKEILVYPPNGDIHFTAGLATTQDASVRFFENPTIGTGSPGPGSPAGLGTPQFGFNKNRYFSDDHDLQLYQAPNIVDDGTQIGATFLPSGARGPAGAATGGFEEFVLKTETYYLFRVTNEGASNSTLSVTMVWYETHKLPYHPVPPNTLP